MLVFPCQSGFRSHFKPLVLIIANKIGSTRTCAKNPSNPIKNLINIFSAGRRRNAFGNMHFRRLSAFYYITLLAKITCVRPGELCHHCSGSYISFLIFRNPSL